MMDGGGGYEDDQQQQQQRHPLSSFGKLFVGGIPWETTRERFTDYFCTYGEVTDAIIMMDKFTGKPRGFGFVTFADPSVADKVMQEEHVLDGRTIEVKRTVPRDEMPGRGAVPKTRKLFVGGLIPDFTEDELKEYFSSFGNVVEHQIMFDHETGRSRSFGFVTFENEESVERILSDGRVHELGGRPVEIKRALPKRSIGEYIYDHGGGGISKSYGGISKSYDGYKGGANEYQGGGKTGRGYDEYGNYSAYMGNYGGGAAGFYGGYGGYGGYGFWGAMYGTGVYGTNMYGGYGGSGGGRYGGGGSGGGGGFGGGKGYGVGGKGYGASGSANGRYHPYQK